MKTDCDVPEYCTGGSRDVSIVLSMLFIVHFFLNDKSWIRVLKTSYKCIFFSDFIPLVFSVNNLNKRLYYFISKCPADSYIVDGFQCNQTKTVCLTFKTLKVSALPLVWHVVQPFKWQKAQAYCINQKWTLMQILPLFGLSGPPAYS